MTEPPAATLRRLANGYQVAQAIHAAAVLGIADLLAAGRRPLDELAAETETHAPSLYRLLRALAAIGLLHEDEAKGFALTPAGDALRSDSPESLAGWILFTGRASHRDAWAALLHSVRTGENAFRSVFGTDVWEWRSRHPEENAIFNRAMESMTRSTEASLVAAYDFGRFETIVDVGGGNGTLLRGLLAAYPSLHAILFDQAHVVDGVDLGPRGTVVAGSFFDGVPAGADAYLLKSIIHDWQDEEAAAILRNCKHERASLLVIERVVGEPNGDPDTKFSDLNMLVAAGGLERTLDEFRTLFASVGLRIADVTPTASSFKIIEAVAV